MCSKGHFHGLKNYIVQALQRNATEAMRESRVLDILNAVWLLLLYGFGGVAVGSDLHCCQLLYSLQTFDAKKTLERL